MVSFFNEQITCKDTADISDVVGKFGKLFIYTEAKFNTWNSDVQT